MSLGRDRKHKAIDWDAVRRRLARAQASGARLTPEQARAVLDERARALARRPEEGRAAGRTLNVVVFEIAGECYALETTYVRAVVRLADLTPLPGAPDALVGVMNLRGQILPVFDLRKVFATPAARPAEPSWAVVLGDGRAELGALAEAVHEVASLPEERVRAPEVPPAAVGPACLRGVTAEGLIVLDGAALLRDGRLFVNQGDEAGA
jgi:purine-binding chemotaxis protein CheW